MVSYVNILKALIPFVVMIFVVIGYQYTGSIYFKYFPVLVNFLIFFILFVSLFFKKTILQIFVVKNLFENDKWKMDYFKNLTYISALFMFANFIMALATVSMSTKTWAIYNTVVYFLFIAIFMSLESFVRKLFQNKYTVEK